MSSLARNGVVAVIAVSSYFATAIRGQRSNNVRRVGDEDNIGAGARRGAKQLAKGFRAAAVHLGRLRRSGIGQVRRLPDVLEAGQGGGFVGAVELAGVDLADRRADLP